MTVCWSQKFTCKQLPIFYSEKVNSKLEKNLALNVKSLQTRRGPQDHSATKTVSL